MDLYDYYHQKKKHSGLKIGDLADALGCSRCHMSLIVNGKSNPGFHLALRIEQYTGGAVKCIDMMRRGSEMPPETLETPS